MGPVSRKAIAAALAAALGAAVLGATAPLAVAETELAEGGTLRVGVTRLSTADAIDPARASTVGGYLIARQLYDTLTEYGTDGQVAMRLAESIEADGAADVWIIRLREAVWHDGSPVTADDVIHTFRRILDPESPLPPANSLPFMDPDGLSRVDDRTVRVELRYPTMILPNALTSPTMAMVPQGFDPEAPIGSGPFRLESFEPGTRMAFAANPSYWRDGLPRIEALEVVGFPDSVSAVNALLGGQIDAAPSIDPALAPVVERAGDRFTVFEYPTSGTLTWQMNAITPPFDDVRVRQALRLAVNRQQIVDQVYDGRAIVGNDIFSPFDPAYSAHLPQREQDIEAARALLAEAGYPDGLTVEMTAAPIQPTADRQNEVLIQQAAAAGFDIRFNRVDTATYYGPGYGTYPLSLSYWGLLSIFDQAAFTIVNDAPYNATKWQDDAYDALYQQAIRTVDDEERTALIAQMQEIEYERGPYVVAVFLNNVGAYASTVAGYQPYPNTSGGSGHNFYEMGFRP